MVTKLKVLSNGACTSQYLSHSALVSGAHTPHNQGGPVTQAPVTKPPDKQSAYEISDES